MNKRRLAAISTVVFIFVLALEAQPVVPPGTLSVHAASRSIALEGLTLSGWNGSNPVIAVTQGDVVTMTVSSGDEPHWFDIDVDRSGRGISPACPPDKCSDVVPPTTIFSFDVDFPAGNYTYYCPLHAGSMWGTWTVKGFTLGSVPPSLRIVQGYSNTSDIQVTSANGFADTVSLTATVSPSGPSPSIDPTVTVFPSNPGIATLTVSTTDTTAAGSYMVTITGTSGSSSDVLDVAFSVVEPDFSVSADPKMLVIPLGSSQISTIALGSLDHFSGFIDLSTSVLPNGVSVTFNPRGVSLSADEIVTSTMNVTASLFATPGTFPMDIVGTSGSLQRNATVTVVAGRDFGISSNPTMVTVLPGQSATPTVTVTSFNSFTDTVDLSVTASPSGLAFSINPLSVTVLPDGTATAVLNVTAFATTPVGMYIVIVAGTNGSISHAASVTVSVQDFSIASSVKIFTLSQGSSGVATISVTGINGFIGSVGLATATSSGSISALLNATSVSLGPLGTGFATLTLNMGSAPAGNYTVTVTGTVSSLVRSVSITITVLPPVIDGGLFYLPVIAAVVIGAIAASTVYLLRRGKSRRQDPRPA